MVSTAEYTDLQHSVLHELLVHVEDLRISVYICDDSWNDKYAFVTELNL